MIRRTFTEIAGVYDRMNHILSLGLDRNWRRRAAHLVDGNPTSILDLACGTGDFAFALSNRFPEALITGIDLTPAMLDLARRKNHSSNITFLEADAGNLQPFNPSTLQPFNLVSCAFGFRNFTDKQAALRNVRQLIAPCGQLLVLEFFRPANVLLRTLTDLWLLILSRLFAHAKKESYDYLRRSMRETVSEREFVALAKDSGFRLRKRRFLLPCCSCLLFASD